MEECGVQLVARLPPLPGVVLEAWTAMLGDAEDAPSHAAALVLHGLVLAGADEARRVISTPGFTQVGFEVGPLIGLHSESASAPEFALALNPAPSQPPCCFGKQHLAEGIRSSPAAHIITAQSWGRERGESNHQGHTNSPTLSMPTPKLARPPPQPSGTATEALSRSLWRSSAMWRQWALTLQRASPPLQSCFLYCCAQFRGPRLLSPRMRLECFARCVFLVLGSRAVRQRHLACCARWWRCCSGAPATPLQATPPAPLQAWL